MYSTKNIKYLTVGNILAKVSEYEIFRYYIGKDVKIGEAISSPLRKDSKPSFALYNSTGEVTLRYKDFSSGENGSCFSFVQRKFGCSFREALNIINTDFKLNLIFSLDICDGTSQKQSIISSIVSSPGNFKERSVIEVTTREWNSSIDKDYWTKYGINVETLNKYQVYPLKAAYVKSQKGTFLLKETKSNPIYGYYFDNGIWKIYQPFKENYRWFTNASQEIIQGYKQLSFFNHKDIVVITKSLKDILLMSKFNIPAIAPQSESTILPISLIEELKRDYKKVILNYDFDYAGITYGNFYKKKYGIQCIYLTNGRLNTIDYKAKDLTDYCKLYGIRKTEILISSLKKTLK